MSDAAPAGVLILPEGDHPTPPWLERVAGIRLVRTDPRRLDGSLSGLDFVLLDGHAERTLELARAVHDLDAAVQLVVVADRNEHRDIRRTILLSPGLGEIWINDPAELNGGLTGRAASVTRSRRSARPHQERLRRFFTRTDDVPPARRRVSDAFLGALLRVLPAPVISLDDEGLLAWNPAAAALFGDEREEAARRSVAELAKGPMRAALQDLLMRGRRGQVTGELTLDGADGERICELRVAPVPEAGEGVRVVVIHDLTAEREYQRLIEEQASELEVQTEELRTQTDELELRTAELVEQRREVERVMEQRARFFATMSHELRTPVNAILGYNDLLLGGVYDADPGAGREALERAQAAARHLVELVNDVLDLSKLEAGKLEIAMEEVDLPALLQELTATVEPSATQRGVELRLDTAGCGTVVTDPRRLRQILLNLISNAIRFGEGAPVTVRCVAVESGIRVEVEDRGPGIPPEDQEAIFDEFVQLESSPGEGTGLGLPISLRLAQAMGGRLTVDSEPGAGSIFRVDLPPAATPSTVRGA